MSATVTTSHGKATRAQEHRTSIVWHKAKSVVCIQLSECSDFDKTKKKYIEIMNYHHICLKLLNYKIF